jgi:high-affinity nickel permease
MDSLPILIILYAGLTHALEADHVLALSNIVTQRKGVAAAAKDGIYWGIGHTATILVIGSLMILFKMHIAEQTFSYFEAIVGLMLVIVAIVRLVKFYKEKRITVHSHPHTHAGENEHRHVHLTASTENTYLHKASFGIGLVHGLAGSGALVVLAMTQFDNASKGMLYLLIYGVGAIAGMFLAAALFSIPFAKRIMDLPIVRDLLTLASSLLCLVYGFYVMYQNLSA